MNFLCAYHRCFRSDRRITGMPVLHGQSYYHEICWKRTLEDKTCTLKARILALPQKFKRQKTP